LLLLLLLSGDFILFAQNKIDCNQIDSMLLSYETRISKINLTDPDLIPLHYFFMQDIKKELDDFSEQVIPLIPQCNSLNYYQTVSRFDNIAFNAKQIYLNLDYLKNNVDSIFYGKALVELSFGNINNAYYFLNRALQYNKTNPNALLLKSKLLFNDEHYSECIDLIQILYQDSHLDREHEKQLISFTSEFYDKLYRKGDSLVKIDKASEALDLFKILELFCVNMPSNYCNDDYYHGILRSKTGVYESYIAIAKAAEKRHNPEMTRKFYDYAEQYRLENEGEIINSAEYELISKKLSKSDSLSEVVPEKKVPLSEKESVLVDNQQQVKEQPSQPVSSNKVAVVDKIEVVQPVLPKEQDSTFLSKQKEIEYNRLVIEGVDYCKKDDFENAFMVFGKAIELSKCNCFATDERVDMLYEQIRQLIQ